MFKHSVPINPMMIDEKNLAAYKEQIVKGGFKRVFLITPSYIYYEDCPIYTHREKYISLISEFRSLGLEVGIWFNGFGHGAGFHTGKPKEERYTYQLMVGADGVCIEECNCPLDRKYMKDYLRGVEAVASMNPDLIMLDDDTRINTRRYKMGCTCPLHLAEYAKLVGEEVPRENIERLVFSGGNNKYRKAWFKLLGDTLRNFAKEVRCAVDKHNENIRVGLCTCYDTWDYSGTDGVELAKIFAGNTEPFTRTISPPYHYKKVAVGVEQTRMQAEWCRDCGIEVFAEGDTYPRTRQTVPARLLEMFDLALLSTGEVSGVLKYVYDYNTPNINYETEFVNAHLRNGGLREQFAEIFGGKEAVGVRAYEVMHKNENWVLPDETPSGVCTKMANTFFSRSIKLLTLNSIPVIHKEGGVPVVFGENARYISKQTLASGAVLDAVAAKILKERGIDTGLIDCVPAAYGTEEFPAFSVSQGTDEASLCKMQVSEKAEILSLLKPDDAPGSYLYENAEGMRFYVLALNAYETFAYLPYGIQTLYESYRNALYYANYARQMQLTEALEWIGRKPLPAKCAGHPFLYMTAAKSADNKAMSVALFNVFEDEIAEPVVTLDKDYTSIRFVNCSGELCGNKVKLSTISPYGIAAFEVK